MEIEHERDGFPGKHDHALCAGWVGSDNLIVDTARTRG
jgi:hypothetical protein